MQEQTKTAVPKLTLTARHYHAAVLVAEDYKTDQAIADEIGISKRQLERWKEIPEFQARVLANIEEMGKRLLRHGIARQDRRIARQDKTWRQLQTVIEERAEDAVTNEKLSHVPGALTGHIIHQLKGVGKGEDFKVVDEYSVDTALLGELRALETHVEKSLGQAAPEKRDVTSGGKVIGGVLALSELSEDEIDRRLAGAEGRETSPALPAAP